MTQIPGSTPPPSGYPPASQPPPAEPSLPIGLSITALILGILSFALCCVGTRYINLGMILALVAIVIGFIAIQKAGRGEQGGRGLAVAGVVLGVINVILNIIMILLVTFGGPRIEQWLNSKMSELEHQQQMNQPATQPSDSETGSATEEPSTESAP
jgi:hypothetical protein